MPAQRRRIGRTRSKWALVASAKDDEQASIRPFETIKVSLGELWR